METAKSRLEGAFREFGRRIALVESGRRPATFADLDRWSASLADKLTAAGLEPGATVAVCLPNSSEALVSYFAVWRAGMVPLPIHPLATASEIATVMRHAHPAAAIAARTNVANVPTELVRTGFVAALASASPDLDAPDAFERIDWDGAGSQPELHPPDVAALLYTSGTESSAKGVVLTHAGICFAAEAQRVSKSLTPDDRILSAAPISHSMGLIATAFTNAVNGCQSVLCDGFRFPDVIDMIGRNGVTILPTSPGVLNALVMLKTAPPLDSVRLLYCTTAPLGHEIRQRAAARFGRHIYELYGMTETSTLVTFGPLEPKPPVGSVGRPVPGAEVRIRDAERRDLPVGTHGEVWVRSPGLMKGYYKNDGQTRKAVVSGWYRSGDVGFVDADGHLFIVDRIKDVIFVGGQNVYPSEIEAALQAYEGVATAVVVKMAHPATIEAPLAYVVPVLGARLDAGELLAYLRGRLTPYKMPRRVEIVDSLPIGTSGKIVRRRLTEPPE